MTSMIPIRVQNADVYYIYIIKTTVTGRFCFNNGSIDHLWYKFAPLLLKKELLLFYKIYTYDKAKLLVYLDHGRYELANSKVDHTQEYCGQ